MKLLLLIAGSLLVTVLAVPSRQKRENKDVTEFIEFMKTIKDPETYEGVEIFASLYNIIENEDEDGSLFSLLDEKGQRQVQHWKNAVTLYGDGFKMIHELAKLTLVEGAKPTDQELTDLAKKFSKVMKETKMKVRNVVDSHDAVLSNETLGTLKEIVGSAHLEESGIDFLPLLEEKLPKIYTVAKHLRDVIRSGRVTLKGDEDDRGMPIAERKILSLFRAQFIFDDIVELLKSEENAVVMFKNFAVLTDTLKSASSYESLQAMYNALARSKRFESYAILVRELGKCFGAEISPAERAKWHQHFQKLLDIAKVALADGQDMSKLEQMIQEFIANDGPELDKLFIKMVEFDSSAEGRKRFNKCLFTDSDREVYGNVLDIQDSFLNDDHFKNIRGASEKIYAVVYLIESELRALRRREGLGQEAKRYINDDATTRNVMLHIAHLLHLSEDLTTQMAENRKECINRFNGLSKAARDELVDAFPYRTVIKLALAI